MSLSNTFSNASDGSGEFTLNQYHLSGESMCYNTSYLSSSEIYDSSNTMVQKTTYQYSSDSGDQLLNMGFYHMVYYDYPQAEYDSESGITYDAIGNILTLVRGGDRSESLSYSYNASTKRLSSISVSGSTKSYAYDAAGNVTMDGIRGMTITYNPIEMPYTITKGSDVLTDRKSTRLNSSHQ